MRCTTTAAAVVSVVAAATVPAIGFAWLRGVDGVLPGMSFHFPGPIVIAVAIAAILPARRAARLNVIEALAYE